MKRIVCIITMFLLVFSLASCSGGSYSAIGMVKSNFGNKASLDFVSFKGHYTFVLRGEDGDDTVEYTANLEEGEMSLYYEEGDEWVHIVTLKSGESVSSTVKITPTKSVRVKLETNGKCKVGMVDLALN